MGTENANKFYSADESLFLHDINRNSLWVLGIIIFTYMEGMILVMLMSQQVIWNQYGR